MNTCLTNNNAPLSRSAPTLSLLHALYIYYFLLLLPYYICHNIYIILLLYSIRSPSHMEVHANLSFPIPCMLLGKAPMGQEIGRVRHLGVKKSEG